MWLQEGQGHLAVGEKSPGDDTHTGPRGLASLWVQYVSDSDRRVPAELGQESQASSCLRKGTPLASRVAQGEGMKPKQKQHPVVDVTG